MILGESRDTSHISGCERMQNTLYPIVCRKELEEVDYCNAKLKTLRMPLVWADVVARAIRSGIVLEIIRRSSDARAFVDCRTRGQQMIIAGAVRLVINELRIDSKNGVRLRSCRKMDSVVLHADIEILIGQIVRIFVITTGASAFLNAPFTGMIANGTLRCVGECAEIMPAIVNHDVVVDDAVVVEAARVIGSDKYARFAVFER